MIDHGTGILGKISTEWGEQRHAEQVGQWACVFGASEQRQQGAVGGIHACAQALPFGELWIPSAKGRTLVEVPSGELHAIHHADFVAVLQVRSHSRQRYAYLDAVPF